ncbi:MAG: M1 family metallopeptidase [Candidatus Heimdallarchaeaceae archaeon]
MKTRSIGIIIFLIIISQPLQFSNNHITAFSSKASYTPFYPPYKEYEATSDYYLDKDFMGYSHFYVNATIDPENKNITATMKLDFFNNDNITIHNMYFHLYPNAYANKDLIPTAVITNAYPSGFDPGWINIKSVKVNNISASFQIQAIDNTILNITLPQPILPNATCQFWIEFEERIPQTRRRFGWFEYEGKTVYSIANWIPIPAVYDSIDGWNLDPFYYIGDPFYSDTAFYDVNIKLPVEFVLGSTGNLTKVDVEGNLKNYHWKTQLVRDFACAFSSDYLVNTVQSHGVNVTYLYLYEDSKYSYEAQRWADTILEAYEDYYGEYPYEDLTVAETFLAYGGMEYPQIVFIRADLSMPGIVIAHEVGHQWFYGIIGDDEIDEPWLDEGFASYSEYIFSRVYYGETQALSQLARDRNTVNYYYMNGFRGKINQSTEDYEVTGEDEWAYGLLAYTKMKIVIEMLRQTIGDNTFKEVLHTFYNRYKFQNAFTVNLQQCVEEVTGADFSWFFNQWINKDYLPEYNMQLLSVEKIDDGFNITIKITQKTDFKVLMPIEVSTNYGGQKYQVWINNSAQIFSLIYNGNYPVSVILDPEQRFLMQNDDIEVYIPIETVPEYPLKISSMLLVSPIVFFIIQFWKKKKI